MNNLEDEEEEDEIEVGDEYEDAPSPK